MKQQAKGRALHKLWQMLPWLWMAAGYVLNLWYQLVPGGRIVDSDMASEMILAQILNEEKALLFTPSWYYSTEIRSVGLQPFFRIGLWLFPDNWTLARTVGMAFCLALYAAAAYCFTRAAGLGQAGVWAAAALLWPFGRLYLIYTLFGGYYLVHAFLYMVMLALILRGVRAKTSAWYRNLLLAALVAVAGGTNSVKELMVFHAPFVLAAAAALVIALHTCRKSDWRGALRSCTVEVRVFLAALLTAFGSLVGYVINVKVLAVRYSFKSFGSVTWGREQLFTLGRVLMDFFHEFGYQDGVGVFHFSGIASGVGLLVGAWLVFCLVRLVLRYQKLTPAQRLIVLLMLSMLAVCGLSYSYFDTYCTYYWMTCIPMAVVVMAVELQTEDFRLPGARGLSAVVLSGAMVLCSANNIRQETEHPTLYPQGIDTVARWLVDNNLTEGYATFWNSNVLTEHTSGKIQTWTLNALTSDSLWDWLQRKSHMETDPQHPFLLVDTQTDLGIDRSPLLQSDACRKAYDDGRFCVYVFDTADEVHAAARATTAAQ